MKCSVVLCSYNGEKFIREQLESIGRQSRLPQQLFISDDGSTDGTWEIIISFRAYFDALGIEYVFERNAERLGVTKNFEKALSRQLHEVVFLCDQDDRWLPNRISVCMSEFESDSGLMCVNSDAAVIDENGFPVDFSIFDALKVTELERQMAHQGNFTRVIPVRNLFTGATMAIRREVLQVALPLDDQMIHDDWIGSVSWVLGGAFTIYSPLIEYRVHGQNSVGLGAGERSTKLSGVAARLADLQHQISRLAPLEKRFRDRGLEDYPRIKHLAALLKHLRFRVSMYSLPRDKRLVGIMRELLSRNYSAHSNGAISAIMDIILRCEN